MPDEKSIFIRNHTLTDRELSEQFAARWMKDPTSEATLAFRSRALTIIHGQWEETNPSEINPFPEGFFMSGAPDYIQASYKVWQQLSPDIQKKVSYYQKNWEWFVNIDGTKISLQNESTQSNPDAGIYVDKDNTYFSHSAALARVKSKGWSLLPDPDLWLKMADFLGGFKQLRDILQIPLAGFFHPRDGLNEKNQSEKYCLVWSSQESQGLYIIGSNGRIATGIYNTSGLSVRLLDESVSESTREY